MLLQNRVKETLHLQPAAESHLVKNLCMYLGTSHVAVALKLLAKSSGCTLLFLDKRLLGHQSAHCWPCLVCLACSSPPCLASSGGDGDGLAGKQLERSTHKKKRQSGGVISTPPTFKTGPLVTHDPSKAGHKV
jgi:hypothetical protein